MAGICAAGMAAAEGIADADLAGPSPGAEVVVEQGSQAGLEAWLAAFRARARGAGDHARDAGCGAARACASRPMWWQKDRNQSEFTKTIWVYLDTAVSEDRVANGKAALARHRDLLERIEARYGVEKEVVVAIWGLESAYGDLSRRLSGDRLAGDAGL